MQSAVVSSFLCLLIVLIVAHSPAQVVDVGNSDLAPNTAGQTIQLFVLGGTEIETLNLNVQIGDGTSGIGPVIEAVDVVTGTIFADPNNSGGQFDLLNDPQVVATTVATPLGTTVPATGLLATLTVSTEGVASGVFELKLAGTLNGDTDFGFDQDFNPITGSITNGTITVIPEPTTALFSIGFGGLLLARHRGSC